MLKYIHQFVQNFLKETSKTRPKSRKRRTVDIAQQRATMRPEILAIEFYQEGKDSESAKEIEKLKKSYKTLMTKYVSPKIDLPLMRPGRVKSSDDLDFLSLKRKQEMIRSLASRIFNETRRNPKHSRALLGDDQREESNKPPSAEELKLGWTGQPTSKQAAVPMVEKPTDPFRGSSLFSFSETQDSSSQNLNTINPNGLSKTQNYQNKHEKSYDMKNNIAKIHKTNPQNMFTKNLKNSDKQIITSEKIFNDIYSNSTEANNNIKEKKLKSNLQMKIIPKRISRPENNVLNPKCIKAKPINRQCHIKDETYYKLDYPKNVEDSSNLPNLSSDYEQISENSEENTNTKENKIKNNPTNEVSSRRIEVVNEYSAVNSDHGDGSLMYFSKDQKEVLQKTEENSGQYVNTDSNQTVHQYDESSTTNINNNCAERTADENKKSNDKSYTEGMSSKLLGQDSKTKKEEIGSVEAESNTKNISPTPKVNESEKIEKVIVNNKINKKQNISIEEDKLHTHENLNTSMEEKMSSHLKNDRKTSSVFKKDKQSSDSDKTKIVTPSRELNSSSIMVSVADSNSKKNNNQVLHKKSSKDTSDITKNTRSLSKSNNELDNIHHSSAEHPSEYTHNNVDGLMNTEIQEHESKIKKLHRYFQKLKENTLNYKGSLANVQKKYPLKSNSIKSKKNVSRLNLSQNKDRHNSQTTRKLTKCRRKRMLVSEDNYLNNESDSRVLHSNKNENHNEILSVNCEKPISEEANCFKMNTLNTNIFPEYKKSNDVDIKTKRNSVGQNTNSTSAVKKKKAIDMNNRKLHTKKPIFKLPNLQMYGAKRNIYTHCNPRLMSSSSELNIHNNYKINRSCNLQTKSLIIITDRQSFNIRNDRICPITTLKRNMSSLIQKDNKTKIHKRNMTISRNQSKQKTNSEDADKSKEITNKDCTSNSSESPTNKFSNDVQQVFNLGILQKNDCVKNSPNTDNTAQDKCTRELPGNLENEIKTNENGQENFLTEEQGKFQPPVDNNNLNKNDNIEVLYNRPELTENTLRPDNSKSFEENKDKIDKRGWEKSQELNACSEKDEFFLRKNQSLFSKKWKSKSDRLKIWKSDVTKNMTANINKPENTTDITINKIVEIPSPHNNTKFTTDKNLETEPLPKVSLDIENKSTRLESQTENIMHTVRGTTDTKRCEVENNKLAAEQNNTEIMYAKTRNYNKYLTNIFEKSPPNSPKDTSTSQQSKAKSSTPSVRNTENNESNFSHPSNSFQKWREFELKLKDLESKLKALEMKSVDEKKIDQTPKNKSNQVKNITKNTTVIKTVNEDRKVNNILSNNLMNTEIKSDNPTHIKTDVKNLVLPVRNDASDKNNLLHHKNHLSQKVKDLEMKLKHIESQLKGLDIKSGKYKCDENDSKNLNKGQSSGINLKGDLVQNKSKCPEKDKTISENTLNQRMVKQGILKTDDVNKGIQAENLQRCNIKNCSVNPEKNTKSGIFSKSVCMQSKSKFLDEEIKKKEKSRANLVKDQNTDLNKNTVENLDIPIRNETKSNKKDNTDHTLSQCNAPSKELQARNPEKKISLPKKTDKHVDQNSSVMNKKTYNLNNNLKNTNINLVNKSNRNIISKKENNVLVSKNEAKASTTNKQDTVKQTLFPPDVKSVISVKNESKTSKKTVQHRGSDENLISTTNKLNKEAQSDLSSSIASGKLTILNISKSLGATDTPNPKNLILSKKFEGNILESNTKKSEKNVYPMKSTNTKLSKQETDKVVKMANSRKSNFISPVKIIENHNTTKKPKTPTSKKLTEVSDSKTNNQHILKKSYSSDGLGTSTSSKKEILNQQFDNMKVRNQSTEPNKNECIQNTTRPLSSNFNLMKMESVMSDKNSEYKQPVTRRVVQNTVPKKLETNKSDSKNKNESSRPNIKLSSDQSNKSTSFTKKVTKKGFKKCPSTIYNRVLKKSGNMHRHTLHEGLLRSSRLLKSLKSSETGNILQKKPDQSNFSMRKNLNKNKKHYKSLPFPKLAENVRMYSNNSGLEKNIDKKSKKNTSLSTFRHKLETGMKGQNKTTEHLSRKKPRAKIEIHPIEKEEYKQNFSSTNEYILKNIYPKHLDQSLVTSKCDIKKREKVVRN